MVSYKIFNDRDFSYVTLQENYTETTSRPLIV